MNKDMFFLLYQARYLSAGDVNFSEDQNVFFSDLGVDWNLKSSSEPGMLTEWAHHGDPRQS